MLQPELLDGVDSFIFIVPLWNVKKKRSASSSLFLFKWDNGHLFSLCSVSASYESEGTLMQVGTDAACPPAASLSDFDVTDRSSDSHFSVWLRYGFLHSQSIKEELRIDETVLEINSSFLAWTLQGGRLKAECEKTKGGKKWKRVKQWALIQTEEEKYPWHYTQTSDTLSAEIDTEIHRAQGDEERNLIVFFWLARLLFNFNRLKRL